MQVIAKTKFLRSLQTGTNLVTFLVTKVINPVSMKPTSNFSILQYDVTGYQVE